MKFMYFSNEGYSLEELNELDGELDGIVYNLK